MQTPSRICVRVCVLMGVCSLHADVRNVHTHEWARICVCA